MLPIKNWSDQLLVNTMLRHYKMRQVSFAILPDRSNTPQNLEIFSCFPIAYQALPQDDKGVGEASHKCLGNSLRIQLEISKACGE